MEAGLPGGAETQRLRSMVHDILVRGQRIERRWIQELASEEGRQRLTMEDPEAGRWVEGLTGPDLEQALRNKTIADAVANAIASAMAQHMERLH